LEKEREQAKSCVSRYAKRRFFPFAEFKAQNAVKMTAASEIAIVGCEYGITSVTNRGVYIAGVIA